MSLLGGLIDAGAAFLGASAKKKQTKNIIRDYNAAQEGSLNALTGARDASLGYYQPYAEGGQVGFQNMLAKQTPGFQYQPTDPSYQFRFNEGQRAVDRSAAAGGSLYSGGTLRALTEFGQNTANTFFNEDFNRDNAVGKYGILAADSMARAQSGYASGVTNALFGAAEGRSGARTQRGEAIADQWGAGADAAGSKGGSAILNTVASFFGF